jgi:hypothetical protein
VVYPEAIQKTAISEASYLKPILARRGGLPKILFSPLLTNG